MSHPLQPFIASFVEGAASFGITLTLAHQQAFAAYYTLLATWNARLNLTRIIEPEEVVSKHFLDSLSLYPLLPPRQNLTMIDVGAGGGFPSVPLKIVRPNIRLTLLEARGKKVTFLEHLIEQLPLAETQALKGRAEEAGQQRAHRQQYDLVVARAVTRMPVLAEYTLPFLKKGGVFLAQKGQLPTAELKSARQALKILGGRVRSVQPVTVPMVEGARHVVVIEKTKPTPRAYPRRPGLPKKEPL